jgi:hypothetical protein
MDPCESIDSFYFFRSSFVWSNHGKNDFIGILAIGSLPRSIRLGFLLSFSASLFFNVVGFYIIGLERTAFSCEMPFLFIIEIFSLFP